MTIGTTFFFILSLSLVEMLLPFLVYVKNQCCQDCELDKRSSDLVIFLDENGLDRRWEQTLSGSKRSSDPRVGSDDPSASTIHDATKKTLYLINPRNLNFS